MISEEVKSINELINRLRSGDINGAIRLEVDNEGKVNKILIKNKNQDAKEITDEIASVKIESPDLSHADMSNMDLSGSDLSGMDLHEADLSYAKIINSDLSKSNLTDANLYKAMISQTDLSASYGMDIREGYMTGSVNLYNSSNKREGANPYNYDEHQSTDSNLDDTLDKKRLLMGKKE